jgi:polar amino acid transport system permease protein
MSRSVWEIKWNKFWVSFIEHGSYQKVLEGLQNTVIIAVAGLLTGIVLGTLIAIIKVVPGKNPVLTFLKKLCNLYVNYFRGTPMVVQLLLGYYVLFPLLGIRMSSLMVCVVIFGMNSAAYVSEIMRGGLLSVSSGQMEAGRALGLSYPSAMMRIVVPQAVKNILPTLGNEFITLIKETSIVSFVAATDLCQAFRDIGASNYEFMVPYLVMAIIYIVLVLIITYMVKILERRLRRSDH